MKKRLVLFISLTVIFCVSCSNDSSNDKEPNSNFVEQSYNHTSSELDALDIINDYRVSIDLPVLQVIEHISYVASTHNDYMIALDTINHYGFDERKQNLIAVLDAYKVGENVAYGYNSPESVVNAWINSSGHRTILEGDYTHFGLSVRSNSNGRYYFTNIFIKK